MVLKPRLARLALTRQSRVFQNQTSVDVLKEVLTPVGGADFQIAGAPPIRDYCAQYRETDLDFFLRICSEEGFTHYWKHSQDNHELVVTDNSPNAPSLGEITYDQTVGGTAGRPFIRSWKMTQRMNTTQVALLDSHCAPRDVGQQHDCVSQLFQVVSDVYQACDLFRRQI
jgi:type VI secretion system secreted protein VgrG